jgi:hypothetical protein
MKHQWKTGRAYDDNGEQRIVARVDMDKSRLYFSDLSRHINAYVPLAMWVQTDKHAIETLVMTNYDYGNYNGSNVQLEWEEKR